MGSLFERLLSFLIREKSALAISNGIAASFITQCCSSPSFFEDFGKKGLPETENTQKRPHRNFIKAREKGQPKKQKRNGPSIMKRIQCACVASTQARDLLCRLLSSALVVNTRSHSFDASSSSSSFGRGRNSQLGDDDDARDLASEWNMVDPSQSAAMEGWPRLSEEPASSSSSLYRLDSSAEGERDEDFLLDQDDMESSAGWEMAEDGLEQQHYDQDRHVHRSRASSHHALQQQQQHSRDGWRRDSHNSTQAEAVPTFALPYQVVMSTGGEDGGQLRWSTWAEAVRVFAKTANHLRGIYAPSVDEQRLILRHCAGSTFGAIAAVEILRRDCEQNQLHPRVAVDVLDRLTNLQAYGIAAHILTRDLGASSTQTRQSDGAPIPVFSAEDGCRLPPYAGKAVLQFLTATRNWEGALTFVSSNPQLIARASVMRLLIRCVATFGGVHRGMATLEAFHAERRRHIERMARRRDDQSDSGKLSRQWTAVSLHNAANIGMVDYLAVKAHDAAVQVGSRLIADVLATGAVLPPTVIGRIMPLVEGTPNFQWHDALRLFAQLRLLEGPPSKIPYVCVHAMTRALSRIDFASEVPVPTMIHTTARKFEAKHVHGLRTIVLPATEHIFSLFHGYLIPLSKALAVPFWGFRIDTRGLGAIVREMALENDRAGFRDTVLLLDTNVLVWMATQNRSINSLLPAIRKAHPHLASKPFKRVVVPFTVLEEVHGLIWGNGAAFPRKLRRVMWSRLRTLLSDSALEMGFSTQTSFSPTAQRTFHLLSYATEFPTAAYQLISRSVMQGPSPPMDHIVTRSKRGANRDESIMNLCLFFQQAERSDTLRGKNLRVPIGAFRGAFLRYHVRRLVGDSVGPASDELLLVTFDRRMSHQADALGVDTFPLFAGSRSRCRMVVNEVLSNSSSEAVADATSNQ